MRAFFIFYFLLLALTLILFGFRGCKTENTPLEVFPDMDRQNKLHEQGSSPVFDDNRADREPIAGVVPHITEKQQTYDHLIPNERYRESTYLASGKVGEDQFGTGIPVALTKENMNRGQELYQIFCAICHGDSGNGNGVLKAERYGYPTIVSLLQQRIIDQPDGEIWNTITYGKNTMGAYGAKIRTEDRWKVVMYVRALQRAASSTVEDVPVEKRGDLGI